ncbi:MAG: D-glycero-beta-D-manno-heptose 1-phosphate adenylyltransferase [Flavobacteriales bacterium]|nr:D-glycero-beta-D-manno-heptose 1-phosphate adenylyltransferase [Flavobacteriales bacterium]
MSRLSKINSKIIVKSEAISLVSQWKKNGETIVFTNGCFDLLHRGHIEYLTQAADLGTRLIIGLNSDQSVKQLEKGELRPIKDEKTRALILAALAFVSAVVIFEEETPLDLISEILPDILVKGGDWNINEIVGTEIVKSSGGQVKTISFVEGYSTTNYVKKIQDGKS